MEPERRFSRAATRRVLEPRGRAGVDRFLMELGEALAGAGDVVVDLSRVADLSSRLLCGLVRADKTLRALDRRLVLSGVSGDVARVLTLTGLDTKLEIAARQTAH